MFRPVYCAIVSHYTRDHAFNTDIPHTALRRVMPTADFSSCSAANNASLILAKTLAFLVVPSSWLCMAPSAQIDNIAVTFSSLQVGLFSVVLEPISRVLDISITIRVFLLHEVHADFVRTLTAGQRLPTSCVVYSYAILMFFNHCKLGVFSLWTTASSFKLYNK